jgi:hypothetical protein
VKKLATKMLISNALRVSLALCICRIVSQPMNGAVDGQEFKPEAILSAAGLKISSSRYYSSGIQMTDSSMGFSAREKIFVVHGSDGSLNVRCDIEAMTDRAGKTVPTGSTSSIRNDEGYWILTNGSAIRLDYMKKMTREEAAILNPGMDPNGTGDDKLILSNDVHNGVPCFVVREIVSERSKERARQMYGIPSLKGYVGSVSIEKMIPSVKIYLIGSSNMTLYHYEALNADDSVMTSVDYINPMYDAKLDEDMFKIPAGYKVIIAKTPAESHENSAGTGNVVRGNSIPAALASGMRLWTVRAAILCIVLVILPFWIYFNTKRKSI